MQLLSPSRIQIGSAHLTVGVRGENKTLFWQTGTQMPLLVAHTHNHAEQFCCQKIAGVSGWHSWLGGQCLLQLITDVVPQTPPWFSPLG